MLAVICKSYGGPELLALETLPDPSPGPGEILLRVRASSINFPDTLNIAGRYQVRHALPFVPGSEVAGIVEALGPGVTGFAPGDRVASVTGIGGFAEKAIANAHTTIRLPDDIPLDFAATFGVTYGTAYLGLVGQARLRAGETVLILGAAGGVGIAAIEIAKASGAKIIAAVSTDAKAAAARDAGADHTIGYDALKEATRILTNGRGVDVVFDPIGDRFAEPALRGLAWEGRYLVVGFAAGQIPSIPLNLLLLKSASVVGVYYGDWAARNPARNAEHVATIFDWFRAGAVTTRIGGRYTLGQVPEALDHVAQRHVVGKLLIEM